MLSSAASIAAAIIGSASGQQALAGKDFSAWVKIEPAVITVLDGGVARGSAALIDGSGLFLAHRSIIGRQVSGRTSAGKLLDLVVTTVDEPTGLVLLSAPRWSSDARPLVLPERQIAPGTRLFAALAGGPIRAELVSTERLGVISQSRRLMPLNEIKFETPQREVAGALIFTYKGELVGALNATLESSPEAIAQQKSLAAPVTTFGGARLNNQAFGPGTLTVAYAVGSDVFRRVVQGFLSPNQQVLHPALGVLCKDSPFGGAEVTQVNRGSAADKAGVKVGDVIVDIGGSIIRNQVDFAKVMLRQEVGAAVKITVLRGQGRMILDSVIGAGD